jgi:hypothetical protein
LQQAKSRIRTAARCPTTISGGGIGRTPWAALVFWAWFLADFRGGDINAPPQFTRTFAKHRWAQRVGKQKRKIFCMTITPALVCATHRRHVVKKVRARPPDDCGAHT